jgi:transposase-like protein
MKPTDEIKRRAVKEYLSGIPATRIADHLTAKGVPISENSIYRWARKAEYRGDAPPSTSGAIVPEMGTIDDLAKKHLKKDTHRVLVIPDMHHPFCHQDTLEFLKAVRNEYKTDTVVCLGDDIDAHAFSRYPMDPDGYTAGKELAASIEALHPFYREFPNVLMCESNHTVRPWKKAFEAGLPQAFLPTYATIMKSPDGWVWQKRHSVDGVYYIHGDSGKSGFTAHINYMKAFKRSVVIGHIHSFAGVNYEGEHFGMNAGCLIDVEAYCFKYAKGMPINVNLGCGVVLNGKEAHFIPMHLNEDGRWIGSL